MDTNQNGDKSRGDILSRRDVARQKAQASIALLRMSYGKNLDQVISGLARREVFRGMSLADVPKGLILLALGRMAAEQSLTPEDWLDWSREMLALGMGPV